VQTCGSSVLPKQLGVVVWVVVVVVVVRVVVVVVWVVAVAVVVVAVVVVAVVVVAVEDVHVPHVTRHALAKSVSVHPTAVSMPAQYAGSTTPLHFSRVIVDVVVDDVEVVEVTVEKQLSHWMGHFCAYICETGQSPGLVHTRASSTRP